MNYIVFRETLWFSFNGVARISNGCSGVLLSCSAAQFVSACYTMFLQLLFQWPYVLRHLLCVSQYEMKWKGFVLQQCKLSDNFLNSILLSYFWWNQNLETEVYQKATLLKESVFGTSNNFLKEDISMIILNKASQQQWKLMRMLNTCSYWSKKDCLNDSKIKTNKEWGF
jgi:hypothetical protein